MLSYRSTRWGGEGSGVVGGGPALDLIDDMLDFIDGILVGVEGAVGTGEDCCEDDDCCCCCS